MKKSILGLLVVLLTSLFVNTALSSQVNARTTTVDSAWQPHKYKCPSNARFSGTWGQTKNFDITICYLRTSKNPYKEGAYYIGTDKRNGNTITIQSNNNRFINGNYEYKLEDYDSYDRCYLQVLKNGKVVLNERFEEWMFMTPPCMVSKNN